MNQDVLDRILRCPSLPTLPAVAVRLIELTSNANVSLDELAGVIQHDQGLAAKILKTVNSSFYGLRRPCANINQAMVMLGMATVKSLALSFSLVSSLGRDAADGFDLVAYWRRGLYTAVAAKCLARAAGVVQEDEAFLGGLLQDIGMIAMHRALGPAYTRVLAQTGKDHRRLVQHELDAFELQHPEIGAMLGERWKLPIELIVPVRYHECPTAAPREHADLVRCVGLGNIAHDVLTDADPGPALRRFHARCAEWFDLDATIADDQLTRIGEAAHQLAPLFHLDTGRYRDPEEIVARARAQAASLAEQELAAPSAPDSLSLLLSDSEQNDPLTGTLLPPAMMARAQTAFAAARGTPGPVAAVSIVIDNFPALVAAGGAQAGDAVLVEASSLIDAVMSARGGIAGRLEPSAFTVLLPGLTRAEAVQAASGLKAMLQEQSRGWKIASLAATPITVSVGVAAFDPRTPSPFAGVRSLFVAARRAAEAASECGGNCVRAFTPQAKAA